MRRQLFSILSLSVLLVITISLPFLYSLPAILAELITYGASFALLLIICFTTKTVGNKLDNKLVIAFIILPIFCYLPQIMSRLIPSAEGIANNELSFLAQSYSTQNVFVYNSNSHVSFFQVPMLVNFVTTIFGVSTAVATLIITFVYLVLMGFCGLFFLKIISKGVNDKLSLLVVAGLAFIVATNLLGSFTYRDIASLLFVLLTCFLFKNGVKISTNLVTALFLVVGITIGSPIAALLLGILFILYGFFSKRISVFALALVPLFYLATFSTVYLSSLSLYTESAFTGVSNFLGYLTGGELPTRVLPVGRTISSTLFDSYMSSLTVLSLLVLSAFMILILVFLQKKSRKIGKKVRNEKSALLFSAYLSAGLAFLLLIYVYIGASMRIETSFSDTRTIVLLFLFLLLPLLFLSKRMLMAVRSKKILTVFFVALVIMASFKAVSMVYPKSLNDPINVVEDRRLDLRSQYFIGIFLNNYLQSGSLSLDYKTSLAIGGYYLGPESYRTQLLSISSIDSSSIIVFDLNGIIYDSLYISPESYSYAYNLSLTQGLVYNSGNIVVVTNYV